MVGNRIFSTTPIILGALILLLPMPSYSLDQPTGKPICSALLYEDAELMKALPERLRPLVESAHVRALMVNREEAWSGLHHALDQALGKMGESVIGEVEGYRARFTFHRTALGGLSLSVVALSDSKPSVFRFLDFTAAKLGWIAKARAQDKITGLRINVREISEAKLSESVAAIGLKRDRLPEPRCVVMGLVGSVAGFIGGKIYFTQADAGDQNGSIYEEQRKFYRDVAVGALVGTGSAVALACFHKVGRNYTIDFNPIELPSIFSRANFFPVR